MAAPAERFSTAAARAEEDLLPLRLPAVIALVPVPAVPEPGPVPGPVVPASLAGRPGGVRPGGPGRAGIWRPLGKQFWLGTDPLGDDRHLLGQHRTSST